MAQFMVRVVENDGNSYMYPFATIHEAENYRQTAECSLGYYAEVYELNGQHYEFLYS